MAKGMGGNQERWSYDVFLNFRGEDVRKNFVSHLYKSLQRSGIYTFKDDDAIRKGKELSSELKNAIKTSKIHLVVFSKNYASSRWCLDELLEIVECQYKSDCEQILIPIYYNVEPSDVRRKDGSFAEPFKKHKRRYLESTLQRWKVALRYASLIKGFVSSAQRSEVNLIDDVTRDILQRLPSSYLHLPTYTVGISSRARRISELMCFGLDVVNIIGIWGMGGIGKTTLAKAAFNEFSHHFEGTCFLENFGEYFKKPDGKAHLQHKLLSDILKRDDVGFNNMDHAVKQRFRNKSVLLVIDDVKNLTQFNSIGIDFSSLGRGSRIIITCRDTHLLEQLGVQNMYSPKELDDDESLELVSQHAFRDNEPPYAFLQSSKKLVEYCKGLPLAIEVLGSFLFKRSIPEWENTLEKLKQTPDGNIQAKLQISFVDLDTEYKEIFLDISCFFVGMDKDYVSCILDGCNLYPEIGLNVLKERCLIKVRDNKIVMHGLLRDMGRQVIKQMSPRNFEKWSRLWDRDKVIDVLTNYYGTDTIEGLSLKAEDTDVENLKVEAFSNLRRLRLLQLSHVHLKGSYEHFPNSLRWLYWFKFPEESIPTKLHLENLVVMDLQHSKLKRLWDDQEQPQLIRKLKYLDLSHSIQLTETPDFSYLPNLEKLLLINCERLVLIHESIKTLDKKLVLLNLRGCKQLDDLPLELYKLKSLETLILSGCSQLERLDDALGELESLTTLKADSTALRGIPSSISQLTKLKVLSFDGCKELSKGGRKCVRTDEIPQAVHSVLFSLIGLTSLKTLRLGSCNLSDGMIPERLESMACLEELDLGGNNFRNLQTDFACLLRLQSLKLDGCSGLQSMGNLPKRLRSFKARNCIMLEKTPDLSECLVLQSLHLTNCVNLVETPGLEKLKTVGVIHMEMCNKIEDEYKEKIMQGWAVSANGGVFILGSRLPNWVTFKNMTHSISFVVPETLNLNDLVGFTLWTTYVSQQDDVMAEYSPKITLKNRTKGSVWSRNPATDHICMFQKIHIWQGHYLNEDFTLETGDQVEVYVDFGDQVTILETGLDLSYREKEEEEEEEEEEEDQSSEPDSLTSHTQQLTRPVEEVENDELAIEETQSIPQRIPTEKMNGFKEKTGMVLKKLLRDLLCSRKGEKNEKDV